MSSQETEWLLAEKARLEFWLDRAFAFASAGDAFSARRALTSARWGESVPEVVGGE